MKAEKRSAVEATPRAIISKKDRTQEMELKKLERKIKYSFKDKALLEMALTHSSSCAQNSKIESNQRLEFLGDALLDAIVGKLLYLKMDKAKEGVLTKTRAAIVCENSLVEIANNLKLGDFLTMSQGEEKSGGRGKSSNLGDGVEAVIGAIYLDSNFEEVEKIIQKLFEKIIKYALKGKIEYDYKSQFQEKIQGGTTYGKFEFKTPIRAEDIEYIIDKSEGPDHEKTFYTKLVVQGQAIDQGQGKSKKEAEQQAAKNAYIEREKDVL